ncbi:MAG TPA: hypothetical protein DEQ09_05330 [Bacteroidales bacterium]|nr:hypothetical protein [Bacteroidales bacterium]
MKDKMSEKNRSTRKISNPFPGLRPFRQEESDLFFGREGQSEEVLIKLKANRFVTVIGASGSGKSSLVFCGVVPGLCVSEGKEKDSWQVLSMKPGINPLGNMVKMIAGNTPSEMKQGLDSSIIEGIIRKDEKGIINAVNKLKVKKNIKTLIVIDQFEELFRYSETEKSGRKKEDNRYFMNLLVNSVADHDSGISVIMTMRSDYIGECAHFRGLTELINSSNYLVPQMNEDDYRKVITGPVEYAGAKIEDDVVELLISDIGGRTDQLPVLQHALMRTWENWKSMNLPDKPISLADYNAIGKMSEAMSKHADEAFKELDNRGKEICETLFRTITEKGPDNKGIRHPTRLKIIADIARCSEPELIKVIDTFRSSGRSFVTPGEDVALKENTVIDISHESLIRVWESLEQWVDKEAESEKMYLKLSDTAAMFQEGKSTLLRPPDLHLALSWRSENKPTLTWAERLNPAFERTMVYLRTSEKEYNKEEEIKIRAQKKRIHRSRAAAAILGVAAIIAVFLMLFAFVRQIEAVKQKQVAEEQEQQATEQKMVAENKAAQALQTARKAEDMIDIVRKDASEASRQKEIAEKNALQERKQKEQAMVTAGEAHRLRMISAGKSLAVRSIQVIGQGDLQMLLAYQAYLFNKRNKGADNDPDIYMGLYNVIKNSGNRHYKTFKGHEGEVYNISFLSGGNDFFSSGSDGRVLRWNMIDGIQEPERIYAGNEIIEVLTSSNDGQLLACNSGNNSILIIPVSGSDAVYELKGHTSKVNSLAFTPDSRKLVSAGLDGQVISWDILSREPSVLISADEAVNYVDISASGKYLIAATDGGCLYLWDLDKNADINSVKTERGSIKVVRFRDSNTYAVGYTDGMLEIRNINDKSNITYLRAHSVDVSDIQFNNQLNQLGSSSLDGSVKIWNYNDLTEPPVTLEDNYGAVFALAFNPDGKSLLSCSQGNNGGSNIIARSTHVDYMAESMCSLILRNFTQGEWRRYVGKDIKYEKTCEPGDLKIKIKQIKGD